MGVEVLLEVKRVDKIRNEKCIRGTAHVRRFEN